MFTRGVINNYEQIESRTKIEIRQTREITGGEKFSLSRQKQDKHKGNSFVLQAKTVKWKTLTLHSIKECQSHVPTVEKTREIRKLRYFRFRKKTATL